MFFTDTHTNTAVSAADLGTIVTYLKNNATMLGVEAILFGGDMTDDADTNAADQAAFVAAAANLPDIPHLLAIGNHDYSFAGTRDAALFNADYPQAYYTGKSWWDGGFYEAGHSENSYLLLTILGVDYIFLNLEVFPRDDVITWADGLLTTYAARKAIVLTHAYEYSDRPYTDGDIASVVAQCGADYNLGDDMWAMFKTHDNVIYIQSGHIWYTGRHVENSDGGQPVNQVLFNYQGAADWTTTTVRFMRFNPSTETISFETFSPVALAKLTGSDNQFTMSY